MAETKLTGMLHAFALGCLNTTDFQHLRAYIGNKEEYPYQELGEFQNLVALLPSINPYENPPKSIKENIARRLYYIKDEVKEDKPVLVSEEPVSWSLPAEEEVSEDYPVSEEIENDVPSAEIPEAEVSAAEISPEEKVTEEIQYLDEGIVIDEAITSEEEIPEIKEQITEPQPEEPPSPPEEIEKEEPTEIPEQEPEEIFPPAAELKQEPEPQVEVPEEIIEEEETVEVNTDETAVEEVIPEIKAEEQKQVTEEIKKTPEPAAEEVKEEDTKPARSFGEFLAGAEIKPEEIVGNIEFEDYFAEARKAEIQKRAPMSREKAPPPVTDIPKRERPIKEIPQHRSYSEIRSHSSGSASGKVITVVLVILTAAVMYFYYNSELELYKGQNAKMTSELQDLRAVSSADKEVLKVLALKDSRSFDLSGTNLNAFSYGKVIYSPSERKGVISVASLPELRTNMSYQFWISAGGSSYMVHRFTHSQLQEFFPFTAQRVNLNQSIRVLLTEEPLSGSKTPSRTVLLSGSN